MSGWNDLSFLTQQFNSKKDHAENEHKKTNAVDPVHIPNPLCFGLVAFSQIKILCDLSPHTHPTAILVEIRGLEPLTPSMPC